MLNQKTASNIIPVIFKSAKSRIYLSTDRNPVSEARTPDQSDDWPIKTFGNDDKCNSAIGI